MALTTNASVLAFDLGASSGRAIIGELSGSQPASRLLWLTEIHRFANGPVQVGEHLYWDLHRLVDEIKTGIRKAFQLGYSPASFGIDTWGVDFGLLDKDGKLLGNPHHYRDPQTDGMVQEVCDRIGQERLYRESGLQLMPFNTIYQLYAMKQADSPLLEQAHTLLLMPDLLLYHLTGVKRCEFTMATTTQLFHPGLRTWNKPLMEQLGIPSHLFLDPIEAGTEVGGLAQEICGELDVPPLRAIAVGSHDTESAAAAVPSPFPSFAYLVCGTWSLLGTERQEALLSDEARRLQFSNEGGVNGTHQLLKNMMGLWILQECKREWDLEGSEAGYGQLVAEAEAAQPFRSLIDPDDLRFLHPVSMVEEIIRFCKETQQPAPRNRGEFVRCILESLALRYRVVWDQVQEVTGQPYEGLHMVGGGIQNQLLCQFTANAIGCPVWAGPVEASAIGNILVQLQALGEIRDMAQGREWVKQSFPLATYEPCDPDIWKEAAERYRGVARTV